MIVMLGYGLAIIMGMTLGVIGAGGSILTVPILVYFFNIPPTLATSYSLFFVGATALIGSLQYYKRDQINLTVALIFAAPSLIAVYATRRWLMPAIPDEIVHIQNYLLTKDSAVMLLFVSLMMAASYFMIRKKPPSKPKWPLSPLQKGLLVGFEGAIIGVLTGMIGAGGGFLIIPALVLMAGLDVKVAIGSSLFIIAIKSLMGFVGDFQAGVHLDISLLGYFLLCTFIGLFIGTTSAKHLPAETLKKGFGWFTFIMGVVILISEI